MDTILLKIVLLSTLMFSFSDAKGIRVGGFKVPKAPSIPKPKVPVIVPVVIPVGGYHSRYGTRLGRVQCYSCEGSNNDLCVVNPAAKLKKVTCPQNQYCSIVRKEIPEGMDKVSPSVGNGTATMENSTVMTSTVQPLSFTNMTFDEGVSSSIAPSTDTPSSSSDVAVPLNDSSTSLPRNRRETIRIRIERGCKSADFLEGILLSTSKSNGNESEKVFAQLCSTDLCNTGDGRLRCYECQGTGLRHACMVRPSNVSKEVMCQPNESCYVERKMVEYNSTSTNSTAVRYTVSRGCRAASSDDSGVIRKNNLLGMSCLLSDFCNSVDVNKLIRSNSATENSVTFATLVLTVLATFLLQNRT